MARSVAIITSNYWPEPTGTGQTVAEFARHLQAEGFDVHVATTLPYYPGWSIYPEYRGRLSMREQESGVDIHRSWHWVRPNPSTFTRIVHELSLFVCASPSVLRAVRRSEVAYVVSPDLSYALLGLTAAHLAGIPAKLIVKDVQPDAAVEMDMLTNPVVIWASRLMARACYGLAEEVLTLGEGMRDRIYRTAPDDKPVRVLPDTIDAEELRPVCGEENEFRRRFVPPGTTAVLYSGNMGWKQDLDLLVRTAVLLRDRPDIRFYVFGDGAARDSFLEQMTSAGVDNMEHHPLQPRWMLPHMLSGADAVLVTQRPEVVDIVVPSKLLTALAAGAMIVAACSRDSETARLVNGADAGVWVPASDESLLAARLKKLADGSIDPRGYRDRARSLAVEKFSREVVYGSEAERLRQDRA